MALGLPNRDFRTHGGGGGHRVVLVVLRTLGEGGLEPLIDELPDGALLLVPVHEGHQLHHCDVPEVLQDRPG